MVQEEEEGLRGDRSIKTDLALMITTADVGGRRRGERLEGGTDAIYACYIKKGELLLLL